MRKFWLLSILAALALVLSAPDSTPATAQEPTARQFFNGTVTLQLPQGIVYDESRAGEGLVRFGTTPVALEGDLTAMTPGTFTGTLSVEREPFAAPALLVSEQVRLEQQVIPPLIRPDVSQLGATGAGSFYSRFVAGSTTAFPSGAFVFRAPGSAYVVQVNFSHVPGAGASVENFLQQISIAPTLDDFFNAMMPMSDPIRAGLPQATTLFNGGLTVFTPQGWTVDQTSGSILAPATNPDAPAPRVTPYVFAENQPGYGGDVVAAMQTFLQQTLNVSDDLTATFRFATYLDMEYLVVDFDTATLTSAPPIAGQYFIAVRREYNLYVFLVGVTPPNTSLGADAEQLFLAMAPEPLALARFVGTNALIRPANLFVNGVQMRLPMFWSGNTDNMAFGSVRLGAVPFPGVPEGGYPAGVALTISVVPNPTIDLNTARNQYLASVGVTGATTLDLTGPGGRPLALAAGLYTLGTGGQGTTIAYFMRDGNYLLTFAFTFPSAEPTLRPELFSGFMNRVTINSEALAAFLG